jgi:mannan endo-1,6-alpha-mannosidase
MGVDDQVFWGFSALDAVESNFPEAGGDVPSWLALAQGVFAFQKDLWDDTTCGGGYHWQVYSFNAGYNLKNAISNGGNFQLSARLAYVTGNASYAEWAEKVYDWMETSALMQIDSTVTPNILYIWDNTDINNNCTDQTRFVWTYNYGTILAGAAYMYNYTNGSTIWANRVNQILDSTFALFFPASYGGNVMVELQCEPFMNCNQDQKSFKAYLSRWLAVTSQLVPYTAAQIIPKLLTSAQGAAGQCSGGNNGQRCGMMWNTTTWDGSNGVGQEVRQGPKSRFLFLQYIHADDFLSRWPLCP